MPSGLKNSSTTNKYGRGHHKPPLSDPFHRLEWLREMGLGRRKGSHYRAEIAQMLLMPEESFQIMLRAVIKAKQSECGKHGISKLTRIRKEEM